MLESADYLPSTGDKKDWGATGEFLTKEDVNLMVGMKAVVELRHQLRHAYEWYRLEGERLVRSITDREWRWFQEVERHYGRRYLRHLVMGAERGDIFDDFYVKLQHLAAKIVGLEQLLACAVFKPSPGLNRLLSEGEYDPKGSEIC